MVAYQEARDIYSRVVLYEDLCKAPEYELSMILALLGKNSKENVELAMAALETDSQHGVFEHGRTFCLTEQEWEVVDETLASLGLNMRSRMPMREFREQFE